LRTHPSRPRVISAFFPTLWHSSSPALPALSFSRRPIVRRAKSPLEASIRLPIRPPQMGAERATCPIPEYPAWHSTDRPTWWETARKPGAGSMRTTKCSSRFSRRRRPASWSPWPRPTRTGRASGRIRVGLSAGLPVFPLPRLLPSFPAGMQERGLCSRPRTSNIGTVWAAGRTAVGSNSAADLVRHGARSHRCGGNAGDPGPAKLATLRRSQIVFAARGGADSNRGMSSALDPGGKTLTGLALTRHDNQVRSKRLRRSSPP